MADYDTDETSAEFLLMSFPLHVVLDFVNARDDVRAIPAHVSGESAPAPAALPTTAPASRRTMPARGCYVVEADPFPALQKGAA